MGGHLDPASIAKILTGLLGKGGHEQHASGEQKPQQPSEVPVQSIHDAEVHSSDAAHAEHGKPNIASIVCLHYLISGFILIIVPLGFWTSFIDSLKRITRSRLCC